MWSAFLLVPVGAVCVAGGCRGLARLLGDEVERRAVGAVAAVAATVAILVIANVFLRQQLETAQARHDESVSLRLPGAAEVRVPLPEARVYRKVTRAIDDYCASLVMLPGMNSFYVWAEREPPTDFNSGAWMKLFDDARQREVIAATRKVENLCLLENQQYLAYWMRGETPRGPLVRYMHRGFRPLATIGGYRLLRRENPAGRD